MAIDKHKLGKMRNEVLKIIVEVIIGIVLAVLAGYAINIAIKQIPNSEVILLTRGASTNVYLAKVKIAGK